MEVSDLPLMSGESPAEIDQRWNDGSIICRRLLAERRQCDEQQKQTK
jgi:hypothetical protein